MSNAVHPFLACIVTSALASLTRKRATDFWLEKRKTRKKNNENKMINIPHLRKKQ